MLWRSEARHEQGNCPSCNTPAGPRGVLLYNIIPPPSRHCRCCWTWCKWSRTQSADTPRQPKNLGLRAPRRTRQEQDRCRGIARKRRLATSVSGGGPLARAQLRRRPKSGRRTARPQTLQISLGHPLKEPLLTPKYFFANVTAARKPTFAPPSFDYAVQTYFHPLLPTGRTYLSDYCIREHGSVALAATAVDILALGGQ